MREGRTFCVVRVMHACGDGDGFGDRHVALRRKDAIRRALHKAKLIRGRDRGGIPFACRDIVKHSWRIGVRFGKAGCGSGETSDRKCGSCGNAENEFFVHALSPFLFFEKLQICENLTYLTRVKCITSPRSCQESRQIKRKNRRIAQSSLCIFTKNRKQRLVKEKNASPGAAARMPHCLP